MTTIDGIEDKAVAKAADSDGGENAPRAPKVLESLTIGKRMTSEQAAASTRRVRRMKLILPVLAVALIVAFFMTSKKTGEDPTFLDDFAQLDALPEELRMERPRFSGIDADGRPFDITADVASQNKNDGKIIELVNPTAVTRGADKETIVTAEAGVFKSEINILELREGVELEHAIGGSQYVLRTPTATVSIDDKMVTSTQGVDGTSKDGGALRADGMRAYNDEGRVVLEGNVSMRIYPKQDGLPSLREGADVGSQSVEPARTDPKLEEPQL